MSTGTMVPPKTMHVVVTPATVDVEPGETLVFTNNSTKFPTFAVVFQKHSPNDSGLVFTGTNRIDIPVTKDGTFDYWIQHFLPGGPAVDTGTFSVRSCTGGCH